MLLTISRRWQEVLDAEESHAVIAVTVIAEGAEGAEEGADGANGWGNDLDWTMAILNCTTIFYVTILMNLSICSECYSNN